MNVPYLQQRYGNFTPQNQGQLDRLIADQLRRHTAAEAIALMQKANLACARLSNLADLAAHPQNRFRKIATAKGIVEALGRGFEIGDETGDGATAEPLPLPTPGQDNDRIRKEFGEAGC